MTNFENKIYNAKKVLLEIFFEKVSRSLFDATKCWQIQDCTNCFEHIKVNYNIIAFLWKGCLHPCFKCNVQIKLCQNA